MVGESTRSRTECSPVVSPSVVSNSTTAWTAACLTLHPSLSPRVCPTSCPSSWWCHLIISSSVTVFSFSLSFPASGSIPMSCLFWSDDQSIGTSDSALVLPMNIQCLFPLGLTGLIPLQSKELSRAFSGTTVWKHQFFHTQPSLWSNSHICIWLLEKPELWLYRTLLEKWHLSILICCLGLS